MPSTASTASVTSPSRDDSLPSPARSSLVKMTACRPREARLWTICRASVLLPQSIVPEKKTSSGMGGTAAFRSGTGTGVRWSGAYFEQRHELLDGGHRAVQAGHFGLPRLGPGRRDRDVVARG